MELDEIIDRYERREQIVAQAQALEEAEALEAKEVRKATGAAFREGLLRQAALAENAQRILRVAQACNKVITDNTDGSGQDTLDTVMVATQPIYLGAEKGKYIFGRVYVQEKLKTYYDKNLVHIALGLKGRPYCERTGKVHEFGVDFMLGDSADPADAKIEESYKGTTLGLGGASELTAARLSDEELGVCFRRASQAEQFTPAYQQEFGEALYLVGKALHNEILDIHYR